MKKLITIILFCLLNYIYWVKLVNKYDVSVLYWVLTPWSLVSSYVIRSRPEANVRDHVRDGQFPTPPTGPHISPLRSGIPSIQNAAFIHIELIFFPGSWILRSVRARKQRENE